MAISMPEGLNFKLFKRRDLVLQLRTDLDRRCPLMGWRVSAANSLGDREDIYGRFGLGTPVRDCIDADLGCGGIMWRTRPSLKVERCCWSNHELRTCVSKSGPDRQEGGRSHPDGSSHRSGERGRARARAGGCDGKHQPEGGASADGEAVEAERSAECAIAAGGAFWSGARVVYCVPASGNQFAVGLQFFAAAGQWRMPR